MYETTKVACSKLNVNPNTLRNLSEKEKLLQYELLETKEDMM